MEGQPIDLDHVLLTREAVLAYHVFAQRIALALKEIGELEDSSTIPDEQAQILPDGSLEIFVDLPSEKISRISSGSAGFARNKKSPMRSGIKEWRWGKSRGTQLKLLNGLFKPFNASAKRCYFFIQIFVKFDESVDVRCKRIDAFVKMFSECFEILPIISQFAVNNLKLFLHFFSHLIKPLVSFLFSAIKPLVDTIKPLVGFLLSVTNQFADLFEIILIEHSNAKYIAQRKSVNNNATNTLPPSLESVCVSLSRMHSQERVVLHSIVITWDNSRKIQRKKS